MTNQEKFFNKLGAEYDKFIGGLRGQSADEILNSAYRVVCYTKILAAFKDGNYTERDYRVFAQFNDLLFKMFDDWVCAGTSDFDELPYFIEHYAMRELGYTLENSEINAPAVTDAVSLKDALLARVEQNYAEFVQQTMTLFNKRQVFEIAGRIAAMQDAYDYMNTSRDYTDDELRFYLKFLFPVDIVADAWQFRNREMEDMGFAMDYVASHMGKYENDRGYCKI
ncbi:hypothetical protein FACS189490_03430 [Clostridia bacterium]|nr:hypothetical protein FACS189490_03430 [Clostridia bacterium]